MIPDTHELYLSALSYNGVPHCADVKRWAIKIPPLPLIRIKCNFVLPVPETMWVVLVLTIINIKSQHFAVLLIAEVQNCAKKKGFW